MDSVIIKWSELNQKFLKNPKNYLEYLNQDQKDPRVYMEYVEDGILFVYQNAEVFIDVMTSVTAEVAENIHKYDLPDENFFEDMFISRSEFPSEGLTCKIEVITGNAKTYFPVLSDFVHFLMPESILKFSKTNYLELFLPNFEMLQMYSKSLYIRFFLKK
ncbi:hypothetical protein NEF87_004002 [Candidatus Lokiarchaeum ossiferum]|uniref:Uncharacterized protein n=1 Tax=Candidatus Lokiarchaeum ossiferum TaxID=2951803 RepID=A0ABY6HW24_9ARCH|nr:hypothetical protein NEF87_004002 [Candidatus Lokiarchaeum sp. B-35]